RLPPGPVEVLIRTQPPAGPDGETWWAYLQRERAELLANGHTFRTREEIDNDRARQRSADEARRQAIQDLQTPRERVSVLIYLDTNIVIYAVENPAVFG